MLSTKLKEAAGNSADATLYVDDVFSTYLYTGNGATQTITNGIDLAGKGGLVWTKNRSAVQSNFLVDTLRGGDVNIKSNTTAGNDFGSGQGAQSFTSTGFTAGGFSTNTYASWTFRKAAKFFDVVTYTGTGSARTIAHSLGVAPGMIIVKRTDTSGNWQVYSNGLTSAAYSIQLNLTDAQASAPTVWNSTAPTSSVFSVGTDATVNASGGTYVAYLFAHDTDADGIIQCGSFTTDGSGSATVNLGWEPQYLLTKRSDSTGAWWMMDTMRGMPIGGSNQQLWANTTDAEFSGGQDAKPSATGFYVTGTNASATFIYMAIRRPNKPPTSGTQVFYSQYAGETVSTPLVFNSPFAPDLIIDRFRVSQPYSPVFVDRLRGKNIYLASTDTNPESTYPDFISFDGVGGTAYIPANGSANNAVGTLYDARAFKRAPGFFDEVCYTGTGVATTQAHNLTVVPELMIVRARSFGGCDWRVYDVIDGNTKYSVLNSTAIPVVSSTVWNNTTPTSTVFSIGTDTNVNLSTQTYVAYLFATLAGISKVGSYTGNGSGQAIACGFSAGARFVLIKRTDSTGDWYTFDSARGLTSGSSPYLLLNSTAAETTGNNGVYASTGGFTLGSTASTTTNINAATYIFLAVA